jgi:predicted ferric reductase
MKHVKQFFWGYLLALAGLWWFSDLTDWAALANFLGWRAGLMQATGVLAIGVMSAAMLLAVRPVLLEPALGGLDKMYRLHKWLGISALVMAVGHWLLSESPKWLVGLGLMTRPARGPRPATPDLGVVQQFLQGQRGLAEGIGEWAFYAALALMVLALVKRFPYRHFFKTHHLLAVTYLALVWHSVVLLKFDYWSSPLGPVMAVLMGAGSVAAVLVLFGRVARQRQLAGEVVAVRQHARLKVTEVDILFRGRWPGHAAGQFAFVTLHENEGAHPYTITSAWVGDGRLRFIIKALGDYTGTLAGTVKPGDAVKVEGPYGRFNFEGEARRQIWVGGGIGITPFIARMKALAAVHDGRAVDLFHTTTVLDPQAIELLEADARAAGVQSHVLWDERDGLLDAARIAQKVPAWRDADVWFCGPAKFGQALKKQFAAMGLPPSRFHQELFEMR